MTERRLYLDNAATSWPKPREVVEAIADFYRAGGAPAARGNTSGSAASDRIVETTRSELAALLNVSEPRRLVWTCNATDALNTALHGWLRPGDHVIATVLEHNSVLRPLQFLSRRSAVETSWLDCDASGRLDLAVLPGLIRPHTRLVCAPWVSNVTGVVQPVRELAEICRVAGVPLLIDAAQGVGHLPIDVGELDCDLLAAAGHKGLLGPLGTGFLYVGPRVEEELRPLRQGGTGSQSEEEQPWHLPDRFESGNPNVGGLAGLRAGIRFVKERGIESLAAHSRELGDRLRSELVGMEGIRLFPPAGHGEDSSRTGIVSFQMAGMDPHTVAGVLDSSFGIEVRAGLHCAPRTHARLKTAAEGGTVRVSPGVFNTVDDILQLVAALREIAAATTPLI